MSSTQEIPAEIQDRNTITRIETGERWLNLHWADGHRSRFHHLWLRDNCFCSECGETWTGRRYVMLTDFALDIHPLSSELDPEGNLAVIWSGHSHRSVFEAPWLRRHCNSVEERNRRRHRPILWNHTLIEKLPEVEYAQVCSSESSLLHLYELVRDYGIGVVHGVPTGVDGTSSLADSNVDGSRSLGELFGVLDDSGYGEILNLSNQVDYGGSDVDEADDETGTYQVTLPTQAPVPPPQRRTASLRSSRPQVSALCGARLRRGWLFGDGRRLPSGRGPPGEITGALRAAEHGSANLP